VRLFLRRNLPLTAKGYLQFLTGLTNSKDPKVIQTLNNLNRSTTIPFLVREHISTYARPPQVTWGTEFDMAMGIAMRGVWTLAASMLQDMSNRILDEPAILQNLAIVSALNADFTTALCTFRQIAKLRKMPLLERVHAQAIANTLDPTSAGRILDFTLLQFPIEDVSGVMERLLSTPTMRLGVMPGGQPQPKGVFAFLDRPLPAEGVEITVDTIPILRGHVSVFGRQTNREPRLDFALAKDFRFDEAVSQLRFILGELLPRPPLTAKVGSFLQGLDQFAGEPVFPDGVGFEQAAKLRREITRQAVQQKWPDTPLSVLEGKSPRQAALDERLRIPLLAELLEVEVENELKSWDIDINALRTEIGLPALEPIDLAERPISRVPVSHFGRLKVSEMSDDDLLTAYRYAYAANAGGIVRKLALEVVSRDSVHDRIDKVDVCEVLAASSLSTDEALEWLAKSRKLATAAGESPAMWLIEEMRIRILRGESVRVHELLHEILSRYIREPDVGTSLTKMLGEYQLRIQDGQLVPMRYVAEPAETDDSRDEEQLPDSSELTESTAKSGTSRLWLPNSD
jgi:hypothetical protein